MLLEVCRKPPYPDPREVIEAMGRMFDSGRDYENVDVVLDYIECEALNLDSTNANDKIEKRNGFIPAEKVAVQQTRKGKKKATRNTSHPTVPSTAAQEKPPKTSGIYQPRIPIDVTPQHPPPSAAVAAPVKEEASVIQESTEAPLMETDASTSFTSAPVFEELPDTLPAIIDRLTTRENERETIFSQHKGLENIMQSVLRLSRELCTDPAISSHLLSLCLMLYDPHTPLVFAARDYILRIARDILDLASNVPPSEKGSSEGRTVEKLAAIVAGHVANILISVRQHQPPRQSKAPAVSGLMDNEANVLLSRLVNLEDQYFAMSAAEATVRQHLLIKPRHYGNPTAVTTSGTDTAALYSQLSEILKLEERKDPTNVNHNKLRQETADVDTELHALHVRKKELAMSLDEVNSSIAIAEAKREALKCGMDEANSEKSHQTMASDKTLVADLAAMESELPLLFKGSVALLDTELCARSSTPLEHYLVAMNQWLSSQVDFITTLTSRVSKEEERARSIETEIEGYRSLGMDGIVHEHVLKAQKLANDIKEDWSAIEAFKTQLRACNAGLVELLAYSEDWRKHSTLLDCIIAQFNSMGIPTTQLVSIMSNLPEIGKLASSTKG